MAAGSPDKVWLAAINATSAQYRSVTVRLGKGPLLLVGDERDVARARRAGGPE